MYQYLLRKQNEGHDETTNPETALTFHSVRGLLKDVAGPAEQ